MSNPIAETIADAIEDLIIDKVNEALADQITEQTHKYISMERTIQAVQALAGTNHQEIKKNAESINNNKIRITQFISNEVTQEDYRDLEGQIENLQGQLDELDTRADDAESEIQGINHRLSRAAGELS